MQLAVVVRDDGQVVVAFLLLPAAAPEAAVGPVSLFIDDCRLHVLASLDSGLRGLQLRETEVRAGLQVEAFEQHAVFELCVRRGYQAARGRGLRLRT